MAERAIAEDIVAAASEAIFVADDERRIVVANPAACRLTGRTLDELRGASIEDLVAPDMRTGAVEAWAAARAGGAVEGLTVVLRPDGTSRHVEFRARGGIGPGRHLAMLVDVTERVLRERELIARLERERDDAARGLGEIERQRASVLAASPDDITITDLAGNVRYVSDAGVAMFNLGSSEAVVGRNVAEFIAPEDLDRATAGMARLISGEPTRAVAYRARRDDGSELDVEAHGALLRGEDGAPEGFVFVVRDITERGVDRQALAASEERYHSIVNELDAVVCVIEHPNHHVFVSSQTERMFGFSPDEMARDGFWRSRVVDEDHDRVLAVWDAGDPHVTTLEYRMRRADGSIIWIEDRLHAIRDDDGRPLRWYTVTTDVSERHRLVDAERERASLAERLGHVVRLARDITLLLDGDGRIVDVNQAAIAAYGYTREELLSLHVTDLRSEDTRALVPQQLAVAARPEGILFETVHQRKDGSTFPVEVSSHLVEVEGVAYRQSMIRDITERRAAQATLLRTLGELEEAQRVSRTGSYTVDLETGAAEWSDELNRLYGRPPGTPPPGTDELAFLLPDGGRTFEEAVASAIASGSTTVGFEHPVRRPDGTVGWLLTRGRIKKGPDGQPLRIHGTETDVTELHEAREALRKSEALAMAVIQGTADTIVVKDDDGRVMLANEAAAQTLGRTPASMVGLDEHAWFPPDQAGAIIAADTVALSRGERFTIEETITDQAGGIRTFLTTKNPLITADGSAMGLLSVGREITDRKRAEDALRTSAQLQRSIFEALSDGVVVQEPGGRITAANPAARRILGLTVDQITGRTSGDPAWQATREDGSPFPGDEHPAMVTLRTGEPCRDVLMNLAHPDGRRVWISINTEVLRDDGGAISGVVASFSDITAERELAARLRQAERLEAVGQLAGGVAHDFNNMLAAMTGYADLARESLPADAPARADIGEILHAADRASGLTRQLLAFSRRLALHPEVINPGEIVDAVVPMLRRLVGEHIEIVTRRAADLGSVRVDPTQLEQVILNLAVNSRDAMPEGGRLSIELDNATCSQLDEDDAVPGEVPSPRQCVRITVSDTGVGMDAATAARVFEPFFTTKEVGHGTGLGLATVYGIVKESGGHIAIASTLGEGTTMTIDLPRVAPTAVPDAKGGAETPAIGRETVLLVEDEAPVREITARMLRRLGYAVLEVPHPEAALALPDDALASIDVLVTDVVMPGMSGVRLADELTERRSGLRTLMISGYPRHEAVLQRSDTEFLAKPFTRSTLGEAVRRLLDGDDTDEG